VIVDFYREVGYLPDAVLNYLVLLGWSLDDKTEDFTRPQMVELFSLERVNKASASFDAKKLAAFQERHMQALPVAEKVERALPYLRRAGLVSEPVSDAVRALVTQVVTAAGPRLTVAGDILNYEEFFLPDDRLPYDEKALDKHLRKPPAPELLRKLRDVVASAEPFDAATLKRGVEELAQAEGAKPGPVSQMLRVAATGKEVGFGTYETLAILGRAHCLARIDRAAGRV
jgi:glutamyl-tRNA synthetase